MKKFAIIALVTIIVVMTLARVSEPGAVSAPEKSKEIAAASAFAKAVTANVKASPKWSEIQPQEVDGNRYYLTLVYSESPSSQAEVKRDTGAVAKAALGEVMKQGRHPAEEHLAVTVWAQKPEKGATGQDLTRVYGRSVYDFNTDSIEYKPKSK